MKNLIITTLILFLSIPLFSRQARRCENHFKDIKLSSQIDEALSNEKKGIRLEGIVAKKIRIFPKTAQ